MPRALKPDTPTSLLSARRLQLAGSTLALALAAALGGLGVYQHSEDVGHARQRNELLARLLEDHASRAIDAVALATASIGDSLVREGDPEGPVMSRSLRQTLANLSGVRTLAVLAPDGRVLNAAGTAKTGTRIDLARLQPIATASATGWLGRYVPGRGLPEHGDPAVHPPGLGGLPYVRPVTLGSGPPLRVVALLNPDAFATFQAQTLDDPLRAAAMLQFDGQVVAATASASLKPGQSRADLPPFRAHLPEREHASWAGDGLHEGTRLAAFRALRQYPLLVIVDQDREALVATTLQRMQYFLAAGSGAVLLVVLLTFAAVRAQRAREQAQASLDRTLAELAERGRELDVLFGSVREWLFRTDAEGAVQLMNTRWELITGRPLQDAQGRPLAELVAPASRDAVAALFAPGTGSQTRHAEVIVDGVEGRRCHVDLTLVPLLDDGQLVGFAGSGVDMTDLLAAQGQLRAQLAFNTSLIDSNPLPVVVLDGMNRYVRVNRAWETFTGRPRDRVIGTLAHRVGESDSIDLHEKQDARLREQGGEIHYEARQRRADGQLREVYVSKALIPTAAGGPPGIVGVFMDISEFREAERATRQARDAAEQASGAKTEFIANISHELRTPLQSILGFSELGITRLADQPRLAGMFTDIHRAGQRMLALVNDLLDLSKLERAGTALNPQRQDVRDLVQEVLTEVMPLARARQVQTELVMAQQPLVANVDGPRLQQVVRNLLANAIRFSPEGGTVEVHADARARGRGEVELVVADRGPGVPGDELEAIFDPFVQSSRTKDGSGGTGLGLAITRRIVEGHGGAVVAGNRPGGGAVFTVRLPAARFGETQPAAMS